MGFFTMIQGKVFLINVNYTAIMARAPARDGGKGQNTATKLDLADQESG
jgi:hypothetical protein